MIWLQFVGSAVFTVLAAMKLAEYGDVIALRTRLGGLFIGTLLLAMATSLPELLTTINSINLAVPDLAAGNIFGSSMFNMFMLAVLDLLIRRVYILRRVAITHALTGSLAVLLTGLAVFFIIANIGLQIGWVGLDSLLLMGVYVFGVRVIQGSNRGGPAAPAEVGESEMAHLPSLPRAGLGFAAATAVLILITPWLVRSSAGIAEITGLSTGFVGTLMVAIVTSLPEAVTTIAAARIGAYDLAVGNLFGSNIFNIFTLGLADLFFMQGRFLVHIDPALALAGISGLLLTSLGLIGNLARVDRRFFFLEIDSLLIIGYVASIWLLYSRGIGL